MALALRQRGNKTGPRCGIKKGKSKCIFRSGKEYRLWLFFPERRFCHCDNPSPVQHEVCKDEESHDHAGNVMDFR